MLVLFYTFMYLLIRSMCASKWQVPVDLHTSEQLNLYVPAFLRGFFRTAVSTVVASTDLAPGVQRLSAGAVPIRVCLCFGD